MIVKNEETVLGRCLESVREAVDEIIVVDTGSTDGTKEVAAAFGGQVYDFLWQDDFSAARNFSFSKANMDYSMWLDADDVMDSVQIKRLVEWKRQADGSADAVMLRYAAGFDEEGQPSFCYYRERLLRRGFGFRWKGRVHEAIVVSGKIEYLDIAVEHRSQKKEYSRRNLLIYERMRAEGVPFEARDAFYYARELYYHRRYREAVKEFEGFLAMKGGFSENRVEACRFCAYCHYALGQEEKALQCLLWGLACRVPGGELCCDLGKHFLDRSQWEQAAFWFRAALQAPQREEAGGFIQKECYGYVPCVQLSVCYDRLGERELALYYHNLAGTYKPYGREFKRNEAYFSQIGQTAGEEGTSEKEFA